MKRARVSSWFSSRAARSYRPILRRVRLSRRPSKVRRLLSPTRSCRKRVVSTWTTRSTRSGLIWASREGRGHSRPRHRPQLEGYSICDEGASLGQLGTSAFCFRVMCIGACIGRNSMGGSLRMCNNANAAEDVKRSRDSWFCRGNTSIDSRSSPIRSGQEGQTSSGLL